MNIAFVNATRKWGGVKTWCLDNAIALNRQGHDVVLYGRPGPFPQKAREAGVDAKDCAFGPDFSPAVVGFFLREFRRRNTHVCICNISKDLRTAGVAARMLGIPILQHLGAPGDVDDRFKTRLTQRLLAPHLLACSDFVRSELIRNVPILGHYDFRTLHPGTVPAAAPPESVGQPRTIIATSQLNPDKGHADMLHALKRLHDAGTLFRCIIVGTGSIENELKQLSVELGLSDVVEFTGFVNDVQEYLAEADIFVLPTVCEPLGIALEEAMANGLVPVARRAGGVPEIWCADYPELLVDPADAVDGFENNLSNLLAMPDETLLSMKKAMHAHAAKAFHADTQAARLADWLQEFARR